MPVREQFFSLPEPPRGAFTVLVTGGSQGARSLNRAVAESLPLWKREGVRVIHQSGLLEFENAERVFRASGVSGEVRPFLPNIADAYAQAHVIVSRSGMGALSEIAAAGRPSVLVPFPGAADNHQLHNAQAFATAGAAYVLLDSELTGERLFQEVLRARDNAAKMSLAARQLAHPGAARRAADVLEKVGLDLPA